MENPTRSKNRIPVIGKPAPTRVASSSPQFACTSLIEALHRALQTADAHRSSPAWAVHNIFFQTAHHAEDEIDWAKRFLTMQEDQYSIRWDPRTARWSDDGSIAVSGQSIARQCAFWIANGWDFNKQDEEAEPSLLTEDDIHVAQDEEEDEEMEDAEPNQPKDKSFPLPRRGEIVQRHWPHECNGKIVLRFLDIRPGNAPGRYDYVIQEEDNPRLIAYSAHSLDPYFLKMHVRCDLLPATASAPYIVDKCWWLFYMLSAIVKKDAQFAHAHSLLDDRPTLKMSPAAKSRKRPAGHSGKAPQRGYSPKCPRGTVLQGGEG